MVVPVLPTAILQFLSKPCHLIVLKMGSEAFLNASVLLLWGLEVLTMVSP